MKKYLLLILLVLLLTGCKKIPPSSIEKLESGEYKINLNGNEHQFVVKEEALKKKQIKRTAYFDETELISYTKLDADEINYDMSVVKLIKGNDKKSYFVYAITYWQKPNYRQFLFVIDDTGKIIYDLKDEQFGLAFVDDNMLFGNTGMIKVEDNQITYLTDLGNYSDGYSLCQENIITIEKGIITETKGKIIKATLSPGM